jgi:hypothetical protein
MSGGSYGYLCYKEVPDLFGASSMESMEEMEAYLLAGGYKDIARDTRRLIEYIKSAENRISVLHEQLAGVFKAIEWCASGDWGKDSLQKELEKYRSGGEEAPGA